MRTCLPVILTAAYVAASNTDNYLAWWGDEGCGPISSPVSWNFASVATDLQGIVKVVPSKCAYVAITKTGKAIVWGSSDYGGPCPTTSQGCSVHLIPPPTGELETGIVDVVSTQSSFSALTTAGKVISWGDEMEVNKSRIGGGKGKGGLQQDITKIFSNDRAYVAITNTGKAITFGAAAGGGAPVVFYNDSYEVSVAHLLEQDIVSAIGNVAAFAAITIAGKVVTWGEAEYGADSSSAAPTLGMVKVIKVTCNDKAFAALTDTGMVVTWGASSHGGDLMTAQPMGIHGNVQSGIVDIIGSNNNFIAVDAVGKMFRWSGDPASASIFVTPNQNTVAVVPSGGSYGGWAGGHRQSQSNPNGGCALGWVARDQAGKLQAYAPSMGSGSCQAITSVADDVKKDIVSVIASDGAWAAVNKNGKVVTWGDISSGGSTSAVQFPGASSGGVSTGGPEVIASRVKSVVGGGWGFVATLCRPLAADCESCPANRYWEEAQFKCAECASAQGLIVNAEGTGCVKCGATTYFDKTSKECRKCTQGKVPKADGMGCETCSGGKIPNMESALCESCGFLSEPNDSLDACKLDGSLLASIIIPIAFVFFFCIFLACRMMRRKRLQTIIARVIADTKHKDRKKLDRMLRLLELSRKAGSPALVKDVQHHVTVLQSKYTDLEYIKQIIDEGNLKLARGRWFVKDNILRFPRQQDIPATAFWTRRDFHREVRMISVVAVSYCWLHPAHPDPVCDHLPIIKKAVQLRFEEKGPGQVKGIAMFLDYMSLAQKEETGGENPDFVSDRTPEEKIMFKEGIGEVNVLYANQCTETWILQWVPQRIASKYDTRAWPCFERTASSMIKDTKHLITLSDETIACNSWMEVYQKRPSRIPPFTPANFDSFIVTKAVTNGGDLDLLKDKYRETFEDLVAHASSLWFADLGWALPEAKKLAEMLPYCQQLEQLIVSGNRFKMDAALILIKASLTIAEFEIMDLLGNDLDASENDALIIEWTKAGKQESNLILGAADERLSNFSKDVDPPPEPPEVEESSV